MERKTFFSSKDGIRLCALVSRGISGGAVLMLHGIRSDKDECGAFRVLADRLRKEGHTTIRLDFRGQGESGGEDRNVTMLGEIMDAEAAIEHLINKNYREIIVLGASFGAAVASMIDYSKYPEVKALVLWYGALDFGLLRKGAIFSEKIRARAREKGYCLTYNSAGEPFRIGREICNEIEKNDPMDHFGEITIPVHFVHGAADDVVPYDVSRRAFSECRMGTISQISGGNHTFCGSRKALLDAVDDTSRFISSVFICYS